ncbi:MAG: NADH-quinone oxidoreductase subunit NuoN [Alphaproteobacteria bacterium]|nr:NADH-quinone oxidoreductase subunit NuoN [Alphaproteobacteria bacterium]
MTPIQMADVGIILPELFLAVSAMGLLMLGVFGRGRDTARTIAWGAVLVLAITAVIVMGMGGEVRVAMNGQFRTDGFTVFMKVLALLGAAAALVLSIDYFERAKIARFEYPVLVVLATLGMMLMISANSLMALYVGLELQSLALYVCASFHRDDVRSTEAGLKYFVLGALSSGMLLYGASLVYGFTGATGFDAIAAALHHGGENHGDGAHTLPSVGVVVGLVFVIAGLAFKVSAVPFHMWTPDVYEGAPTPVTALFAAAPKIAAIALFVRVLAGPFEHLVAQWQQVIVLVSIASMALGAFAAISQSSMKRLLAYSSIGHMGYALVGLAAGSQAGVTGIALYMALYLPMTAATFGILLCLRIDGQPVDRISDLAGLSRTRPGLAAALAVAMFSMAGIPPLAGFFGKLYVFLAAIEAGLTTLAVLGVLASVVGAYYYLRIIKLMYFDEPTVQFEAGQSTAVVAVISLSTAVTVLFIAMPSALIGPARLAAATLFGG